MVNLSELSSQDTVENVLIYISDSLRLDYLPDSVAELGVVIPTISASTYTASSIPSMMTGRYPANHRVWGFNDVIEESSKLLEGPNRGMDLRNVWIDIEDPANKPPNRVLGLEAQHTLEEASEGFTVVIHEKGAHAPYDFFNVKWQDSPEYFRELAGRTNEIRDMYEQGAESSADRFLQQVKALEEEGMLNDTLVIFTSDHGELLGELNRGGVFAHGSPICPELVRVPTVMMGADIPAGERLNWTISGTDIAPTALSATDRSIPDGVDGMDLWTRTPNPDRVVRSDFWAHGGRLEFAASSAWDSNGGYVRQFGSAPERVLFAIHRKLVKGLQAPANRAQLPQSFPHLIRTFGKSKLTYGKPAKGIEQHPVPEFEENKGETDTSEISKEQLRALGYVE